jgi:RNA polymerase sigma-70 factor (family 1)
LIVDWFLSFRIINYHIYFYAKSLYLVRDTIAMPNKLNKDFSFISLQQRVAEGDTQAFRQIFDLLFVNLTGFSFSFVQSKEAATEVVDEIFVQLWTKRHNILHIDDLRVYLYTATKNASLNYLAKRAKQIQLEPYDHLEVQIADNNSPEQLMISKETLKKIKQAIESLPPRCKLIFKLVREDGLKYNEVAKILNLSHKTIDNQMVIAVSRIKSIIKEDLETNQHKVFLKK